MSRAPCAVCGVSIPITDVTRVKDGPIEAIVCPLCVANRPNKRQVAALRRKNLEAAMEQVRHLRQVMLLPPLCSRCDVDDGKVA